MTGGLVHNRFLQLNYLSADPTIVQFGSIVSEIDSRGTTMSGKLVGYGAYSEKIVSGKYHLSCRNHKAFHPGREVRRLDN